MRLPTELSGIGVHVCIVVRKQRVETYLDPDVVAQLENDIDVGKSEFIREAVNEKLERRD